MKLATLQSACLATRRSLPIVPAHARTEIARAVVRLERTFNAGAEDQFQQDLKAASEAFESDMRPICNAAAAALKRDVRSAKYSPNLIKFRKLLPKLLIRANRSSRLVGVLVRQLGRELVMGWRGLDIESREATYSANAAETEALRQWRSRTKFPTDMSSAEIRGFSRELRLRSVFSARMTNAEAVQELADVVDDLLAGKINMATGRLRMMRKLAQLGYNPEIGFPQDMAQIPPAERGSLRDLSSERRLNLMLETNQRIAANYGRMMEANQPYALREYPALELVRLYWRRDPRGSAESHSPGWMARWTSAGDSVAWEGALKDSLIARKDSPIWPALGDGAGGYTDTLGNPFPPFAFNSGYGIMDVSRARCVDLGLIEGKEKPQPMEGHFAPKSADVQDALKRLGPEFRADLEKEIAELEALWK